MSKFKIGDIVRFKKEDYWYKQTRYPYQDRSFIILSFDNGYARINPIGAPRKNDPPWCKSQSGGGFSEYSLETI